MDELRACSLIVVCFASAKLPRSPPGLTSGSPFRFQCFRCACVSITGRARALPTVSAVGLSASLAAIADGSNDVPCGAWCAPRRMPRSALLRE